MVALQAPGAVAPPEAVEMPGPGPDAGAGLDHLLPRWSKTVARGAVIVAVVQAVAIVVLSGLWWTFDSGPLSLEPEMVLTEPSQAGAVRTYGDHPDLDAESAAQLTVDELDSAGGFDRSVVVVTIPTGSGWVDANQVRALEQWAGGDVATVGMRYSAAPSSVVYLINPVVATESARALLSEVTDRLRLLPPDDRPSLVVHGQSLGARAGVEVLTDAGIASLVDAALWQGRPGSARDTGLSSVLEDREQCEVTAANADDAVTKLSWELLLDPVEAFRVVTALPGADSKDPGTGHSYVPITPPDGCLPLPRAA